MVWKRSVVFILELCYSWSFLPKTTTYFISTYLFNYKPLFCWTAFNSFYRRLNVSLSSLKSFLWFVHVCVWLWVYLLSWKDTQILLIHKYWWYFRSIRKGNEIGSSFILKSRHERHKILSLYSEDSTFFIWFKISESQVHCNFR